MASSSRSRSGRLAFDARTADGERDLDVAAGCARVGTAPSLDHLVSDLAKVRALVLDRMYRMAYKPFVPRHPGWLLLLHVGHDRG